MLSFLKRKTSTSSEMQSKIIENEKNESANPVDETALLRELGYQNPDELRETIYGSICVFAF